MDYAGRKRLQERYTSYLERQIDRIFFYFTVFENKEYMFYTCILYSYFQLAKIALSPQACSPCPYSKQIREWCHFLDLTRCKKVEKYFPEMSKLSVYTTAKVVLCKQAHCFFPSAATHSTDNQGTCGMNWAHHVAGMKLNLFRV